MEEYIGKTRLEMQSDSLERAKEQYIEVQKIEDDLYMAHNLTKGTQYAIEVIDGKIISCECPHHFYRNVICKHIYATKLQYNIEIDDSLFA